MLTARDNGTGPLVLLGDGRNEATRELFRRFGWGRMVVERAPMPLLGERWALDNGAYRDWKAARPVSFKRFARRLERIARRIELGLLSLPEFVVVPDLIGAGEIGLRFSLDWVQRLKSTYGHLPLRWYLVVGSGVTPAEARGMAPRWFDGLFLGGSDRFKSESGPVFRELAGELSLSFHYGRCSTPRHLERAFEWRVESLDTARPLTRVEYLNEFVAAWLKLRGIEARERMMG